MRTDNINYQKNNISCYDAAFINMNPRLLNLLNELDKSYMVNGREKTTISGIEIPFLVDNVLKGNLDDISLALELEYAIENKELMLYYQPQFNICSGEIFGVEALVRWYCVEKGFIPTAKFIQIAEESGQIYKLEKWIIETALQQKMIFEIEEKDIAVSINLSAKTLSNEIYFKDLEHIFDVRDVDYSHITIEITETAIISDIDFAVERLKILKQYGMKIALDDFGTGYSSLTHLKELPIDIVKLDGSFIRCIEKKDKDALIIKSILSLANDLNYEVVAEGIETKEQLEYLIMCNCRTGQGYLMSKPLPIEELNVFLKASIAQLRKEIL